MKRLLPFALSTLFSLSGFAGSLSVDFSTLGLTGSDLQQMSPVVLNEDIQLSFEKGSAMVPPSYQASNGRITLTMGSVIKIQGRTSDISMTSISLVSPKASNTFSAGSAICIPTGTFTIDKNEFTSTWSDETGANSVQISNTMGSPILTGIRITYTGGTGGNSGGDDPGPDIPNPEGPANTFDGQMDTQENFNSMTVINTEASTYTWRYDKNAKAAYIRNEFGSTGALPKDDYLVTPSLPLKAGMFYRLDFIAWSGEAAYPEKIGAYLGNSATATDLNRTIVAPVTLEGSGRHKYSERFTVPADGSYYAALHACSDPGMFLIYATDFNVSRGVLPTAPAEVTDFAAVPALDGSMRVTLSLTAPIKDMAGNNLASLKNVTLYRGKTEIAKLNCTPGARVSFEDTPEEEGEYRYTAIVEGDAGLGFDAVAYVWAGSALPAAPESLAVEEIAPGRLKFQWSPVTKNVKGHDIDPESISYTITAGGNTRIVASGLTGTEAIVDYPGEGNPQVITEFIIRAVNAAGSSAPGAMTGKVAVGTPYSLPYHEDFPNAMITEGQAAEVIADPNHASAKWAYYELLVLDDILPVLPDGGLMGFSPYADGDRATWISGKIDIPQDAYNPYLSFFYFAMPDATDILEVGINGEQVDSFTIGAETRGWIERLIPMEGFKGQTIRVSFTATSTNSENMVCVDNIALKSEPVNDLAIVRARIPQEMVQGQTHNCGIRLSNHGVATSGSYRLSVAEDGEEIWSAEDSGLKRGEIREYNVEILRSSFDRPSALFTVELEYASDENQADNVSETSVSFRELNLPKAALSSIEKKGASYEIAWSAPDFATLEPQTLTEGFESYDEFVRDHAGDWGFIDGDGCSVVGILDGYHSYPGMLQPMAFMVFNNHDGFFPQIGTSTFSSHEGGQCMMSAAVDTFRHPDRFNDDYLISPLLSGNAQTISFYARSSGRVFPEMISVRASSTDRMASSFRRLTLYSNLSFEWTRFEVELPEGTRYFAIVNESYDQYMLFVDDVTFEAAPVETPLLGYDLYLVEEEGSTRLNDDVLTEPCFMVSSCSEDARLRIGARFANGCETLSDIFSLDGSGVVGLEEVRMATPEYYDLNGMRLSERPTSPGIYIETRDGRSHKLVVR